MLGPASRVSGGGCYTTGTVQRKLFLATFCSSVNVPRWTGICLFICGVEVLKLILSVIRVVY